jgi:hypothetical protein
MVGRNGKKVEILKIRVHTFSASAAPPGCVFSFSFQKGFFLFELESILEPKKIWELWFNPCIVACE